jgi:hypothetical protein
VGEEKREIRVTKRTVEETGNAVIVCYIRPTAVVQDAILRRSWTARRGLDTQNAGVVTAARLSL